MFFVYLFGFVVLVAWVGVLTRLSGFRGFGVWGGVCGQGVRGSVFDVILCGFWIKVFRFDCGSCGWVSTCLSGWARLVACLDDDECLGGWGLCFYLCVCLTD